MWFYVRSRLPRRLQTNTIQKFFRFRPRHGTLYTISLNVSHFLLCSSSRRTGANTSRQFWSTCVSVALHVIIVWAENRRNNIWYIYEISIIVCDVMWHGSMKKIFKLCHVKSRCRFYKIHTKKQQQEKMLEQIN